MSKYDFAKRLKVMAQEECEIVTTESEVVRQSAKCYKQLSNIKSALVKQTQQLSFYRKDVEKLKLENKRLQKFKQTEEEQLCAIIEKVEQMQSEYESIKQRQIDQRHNALMKMDCLRSIKEATRTYINMDALPQMIRGVTVCDKVTSCEWRPFCFDPSKHTQREISDNIWHDTQIDSIHKETWEKLILSEVVNLKPSTTEVSKSSVTQTI